jgi:Protein of unknown function (DUF2950)
MSLRARNITYIGRLTLVVLVVSMTACHQRETASVTTFASPDLAGEGLLQAGKAKVPGSFLKIFGTDSKDIISTGNAAEDNDNVDQFVAGYNAMHRWRKMPDDSQILLIGPSNFAFPIPLRKNDAGQWFFDTAAGKDEILRRRVGRNELQTIDVCEALADAQAQYFATQHDGAAAGQYALKFISDNGKQNGLYWQSPEGQPQSPLGPLAAFATEEGYKLNPASHTPFHGYYFRMLTSQGSRAPGGAKSYLTNGTMAGGFAFVAYPAEYGNSGVMTFIINQDGVLLQKDLGKETAKIAAAMNEYDPDATWIPTLGS